MIGSIPAHHVDQVMLPAAVRHRLPWVSAALSGQHRIQKLCTPPIAPKRKPQAFWWATVHVPLAPKSTAMLPLLQVVAHARICPDADGIPSSKTTNPLHSNQDRIG